MRWLVLFAASWCHGLRTVQRVPRVRASRPLMVSGVFKGNTVKSQEMKDVFQPELTSHYSADRMNSLPNRMKSAAIAAVYKTSEKLWQAVFKECDSDNDGQITRRELLVLMKRLGLEIPAEGELTSIIETYDVDENGLLDFDEFTVIMRALGVEMMVDQKERGFRDRKSVV